MRQHATFLSLSLLAATLTAALPAEAAFGFTAVQKTDDDVPGKPATLRTVGGFVTIAGGGSLLMGFQTANQAMPSNPSGGAYLARYGGGPLQLVFDPDAPPSEIGKPLSVDADGALYSEANGAYRIASDGTVSKVFTVNQPGGTTGPLSGILASRGTLVYAVSSTATNRSELHTISAGTDALVAEFGGFAAPFPEFEELEPLDADAGGKVFMKGRRRTDPQSQRSYYLFDGTTVTTFTTTDASIPGIPGGQIGLCNLVKGSLSGDAAVLTVGCQGKYIVEFRGGATRVVATETSVVPERGTTFFDFPSAVLRGTTITFTGSFAAGSNGLTGLYQEEAGVITKVWDSATTIAGLGFTTAKLESNGVDGSIIAFSVSQTQGTKGASVIAGPDTGAGGAGGSAGSGAAGSSTAGSAGSGNAGSGGASAGAAGTPAAGGNAGSGTAGSGTAGAAGSGTAGSGTAGAGTAGAAGSGTAGAAGSGTAGTTTGPAGSGGSATSSGGTSGSGAGAAGAAAATDGGDDSGCSCTVPTSGPRAPALLVSAGLALALLRARRRRR